MEWLCVECHAAEHIDLGMDEKQLLGVFGRTEAVGTLFEDDDAYYDPDFPQF